MSEVYMADIKVKKLEGEATLPMKFKRLLEQSDLGSIVNGKKVCIKMHFGGKIGYTTIHPLLVRTLVDVLKKAGAKKVFAADGSKKEAHLRGYTKKTLGCKTKGLYWRPGLTNTYEIGFKTLDEAEVSKIVLDSDVLIVLSHVKGHGACGFGGAGKNIGMGCVPGKTRGKIHALEGGIEWDESKCIHCNKCIEECPNKANKFNDANQYEIFWHNCKYCRHCILACSEGALTTKDVTFQDFQKGMALVNKVVLDHFGKNIFFINMLQNITIFCDCWGFSTPSLVPDIGILASRDIVSIDRASLDLIKTENLIKDENGVIIGLPEGKELGDGNHLFEKIHGKDPYLMSDFISEMNLGSKDYKIIKVD